MAEVEKLATQFAYEFLRRGQYSASSGAVDMPAIAMAAAASDGKFAAELPPDLGGIQRPSCSVSRL
jgi:hypothetical protein